jgi:hypothetical protein
MPRILALSMNCFIRVCNCGLRGGGHLDLIPSETKEIMRGEVEESAIRGWRK